jgi:hypothetical protein
MSACPLTIRGDERLAHFSMCHFLLKLPAGVFRQDGAPETDGRFVVGELGDLPAAGEAVEDQLSRIAPDPQAPRLQRDEELGHAEVDLVATIARRAADEREAGGLLVLQDDQGIGAVIGEPPGHQFRLHLTGGREHAGVHAHLRQVFQVLRVLSLDPLTVAWRVQGIADTDGHGLLAVPCHLRFIFRVYGTEKTEPTISVIPACPGSGRSLKQHRAENPPGVGGDRL